MRTFYRSIDPTATYNYWHSFDKSGWTVHTTPEAAMKQGNNVWEVAVKDDDIKHEASKDGRARVAFFKPIRTMKSVLEDTKYTITLTLTNEALLSLVCAVTQTNVSPETLRQLVEAVNLRKVA